MIAVLVAKPAHMWTWQMDNQADIVQAQRVRNQFTLKDGNTYRLFVVRGSIDIERLRGYEWDKIIIQYACDDLKWRAYVTLLIRQQLPIDPKRLEYK